jgi:hypothetical protein
VVQLDEVVPVLSLDEVVPVLSLDDEEPEVGPEPAPLLVASVTCPVQPAAPITPTTTHPAQCLVLMCQGPEQWVCHEAGSENRRRRVRCARQGAHRSAQRVAD